jgi:hypothetical protein
MRHSYKKPVTELKLEAGDDGHVTAHLTPFHGKGERQSARKLTPAQSSSPTAANICRLSQTSLEERGRRMTRITLTIAKRNTAFISR